jgi:hypothetical protein
MPVIIKNTMTRPESAQLKVERVGLNAFSGSVLRPSRSTCFSIPVIRQLRVVVLFLMSSLSLAHAAEEPSPSFRQGVQVRYEHFEWREFGLNDEQLLKESGYRVGVQWDTRSLRQIPPDWSARLLLYLGDVDYDGQTQVGEPIQSTTEYYGAQGEGSIHVRMIAHETLSIAPFAGLGAHTWIRHLDNTGGFSDTGYDEWWVSLYGQGGIGARWELPHGEWFGRAGLRYPFWNRAEYDFTLPDGTSGVDVEPGNDLSLFAEVGYERNNYLFSVFAEENNYKKSNTVSTGAFNVFQPKSEQQSIGVQFGVTF